MSKMDEIVDLNKEIFEFEEMTKNAEEVQNELLKDILEKNKETVYLQKYMVNGSWEIKDFKQMPIVTHAEIEPYIQRVVDGDKSPVLTCMPINKFLMSSGTTQGRRKLIPFPEILMDNTVKIFQLAFAYRNREFPIDDGKTLLFLYTTKPSMTKAGIPIGPASTLLYPNPRFNPMMKSIQSMNCTPDEVVKCGDVQQTTYCTFLCGILCRDEIQYVHAMFAHMFTQALKNFERIWEDIVVDIRDGVLSSKITIPSVREDMSKLLRPNPELADLIRTKCMNLKINNWYNLVPTLFPNAKYMYTILTGAMEPYINKLRHYAGDLPLIGHDYGCSEGWMAVNVTPRVPPEETTYVVIPKFNYCEFLPIDNTGNDQETVGLTDVEVGKEYEIIITNYQGFYRYKVGDIVKVMGFYNKTPQLKYICRRNIILSINVDKITERDLQVSVVSAAKKLSEEKLEVVDFSSLADLSTEPGHYVIFWEISGKASDHILQECCNILDISFNEVYYVQSRKRNFIGPLELKIVKKDTFKKIEEHIIAQGTSASQFKMPRSVPSNNKNILPILNGHMVSRFFSTAYA